MLKSPIIMIGIDNMLFVSPRPRDTQSEPAIQAILIRSIWRLYWVLRDRNWRHDRIKNTTIQNCAFSIFVDTFSENRIEIDINKKDSADNNSTKNVKSVLKNFAILKTSII